jgi:predicted nucleic acid-binding protein
MRKQKMDHLFIDTSGWASSLCPQDEFYSAFSRFIRRMQKDGWKFTTSNYVIAELVPLLSSRYHLPRKDIIKLVNTVKTYTETEIIYVDQALDGEAWEHLEARSDKNWSLVDASSFIIMERFGIGQAITTDHHFEQAGFVQVPEEVRKYR